MQKIKIKYIIVFFLFIFLSSIIFYFCRDNSFICIITGKCNNNDNEYVYITENDFQSIIQDELFILLRLNNENKKYSSLNDITTYDILSLIFSRIESDDKEVSIEDVEKIHNSAICLTQLNLLKHQNYNNYKYDDTKKVYIKDANVVSSINDVYAKVAAMRFSNFKKVNDNYLLDVNYLFINSSSVYDGGANLYGSIEDLSDVSKSIVSVKEAGNPEKYLKDNYSVIREDLDTYHFTFNVLENGRTFLTDFSVD